MVNVIDLYVLNSINKFQNPFLDKVMLFFSFLGNNGLIWILLIVGMMCFLKSRKYAILITIALPVVMLAGNKFLKNFFDRERPFQTFSHLRVLVEPSGSSSFPSSHTAVAFTVFGIFLFLNLKYKWTVGLLALGIGFSRIYLNVHYFFDVLGGMALGMGMAWIFCFIFRKIILLNQI